MAAFTFPLAVKLRLAGEGHYALSREDEVRCRAVDALLTQTDWAADNGSSMTTKWQCIIREQNHAASIAAAVKRYEADLKYALESPIERALDRARYQGSRPLLAVLLASRGTPSTWQLRPILTAILFGRDTRDKAVNIGFG